jgi:hypothetical protein
MFEEKLQAGVYRLSGMLLPAIGDVSRTISLQNAAYLIVFNDSDMFYDVV